MMKNEKTYPVNLTHSQLREIQRTLLYHKACVMDPMFETVRHDQDYVPTADFEKRIDLVLSCIETLNKVAGEFKEDYTI